MKKIELTKEGKILLIGLIVLVIAIVGILYYNQKNQLKEIYLDAQLLSEGDIMDHEQESLILHLNSRVKLSYETVPKNKKINISFSGYDKEVINIDSIGVVTALKTGKTKIKIYSGKVKSNTITVYVY